MKQFDLNEYLNSKPRPKVVDKEGREVRIVCTDMDSQLCPVLGLERVQLTDDTFCEMPHMYKADGSDMASDKPQLFFAEGSGYDPVHGELANLVDVAYNMYWFEPMKVDLVRQLLFTAGYAQLDETMCDWIDSRLIAMNI